MPQCRSKVSSRETRTPSCDSEPERPESPFPLLPHEEKGRACQYPCDQLLEAGFRPSPQVFGPVSVPPVGDNECPRSSCLHLQRKRSGNCHYISARISKKMKPTKCRATARISASN